MKRLNLIVMISVTFVLLCGSLHAQTTAFTYQGQLKDGANPANGNYDLRFVLFNPATWEELSVVYVDDKAVVNGLFTTEINFGAGVFNGDDRVVSIAVRGGSVDNANRDPATYTVLSPLQKLTPIPYSIFSFNTTDNWVNTTGDNMTGPLTISGSQASVGMVTVTNTAASGYAGFFTGSGTNTVGLYAYSSGTNAWALESFAEGEGASVAGRFDAAGGNNSKAVEGVAGNDAAVTNYGGYFKAEGNTGEGVYGVANGNNGIGGSFASDGTGGRGVYAYTTSANAWALEAFAEGEGSSIGGHFESAGVTGKAVEGI
ncbi:MAG: hypothetical protein NT106_04465, partial [Candidatus Sumerlaeota bacterium]|nr:hypothetical protein [Candidatus Sumerlaeota bacterium]